MPTYYEVLRVQPQATMPEIEAALDQQYNHWRRLVTHFDPQTVQQANQALINLEQIRSTLTDPAQRQTYDLSLRTTTGGLADPLLVGAGPQVGVRTPPRPAPLSNPSAGAPIPAATFERVDAWVCPKCQKANPTASMFCSSCGTTLGQACANCKTVYEAKAAFCPACGQTPSTIERRRALEATLQQKQTEITTLTGQATGAKTRATILEAAAAGTIGWAGLLGGISIVYGPVRGLSLVGTALLQQGGDLWTRIGQFLEGVSTFGGTIGLGAVWLVALALFVYVMLTRLQLNWLALGGYFIMSIFALACGLGHPLLASLLAGGLVLAIAVLTYQREPKAWIALGLVGALDFVALIASAFIGPFIAIVTLPLAGLLGLVGFRAWTLADLESKIAAEAEIQAKQKLTQMNADIVGLRQELELVSAPSRGS